MAEEFLARILTIIAAVVLCAYLWPGEPEPTYEGKTLSQWLTAYTESNGNRALTDQATNAVHHIGTNALPFLVRWT